MTLDSEPFAARVRAVTLVGGLGSIVMIEQRLHDIPVWIGAAALILVLLLLYRITPRHPPIETGSGNEMWWLAAAAALALGVFFRLRYLETVPIGWGHESLAFVRFARHLVDFHFPYEPYSWYAHTLYSYVIAFVMLFVPSELMALRIASALLSIVTLVVVFLATRQLFGLRIATATLALLASSYWHLFATRNGYHQLLLPLFQGLFTYGLALGLLRSGLYGWVVAAAATVLGLHSHWGFYLMPVYGVAVAGYLFVLHRPLWRRNARPMVLSALIAMLWSIPLALVFFYNAQTIDYVLRGFSLAASAAPDFAGKVVRNLSNFAWLLSGNPNARVEFTTQVDPLVAATSLLGLVAALRWVRESVPHALLILLLAINAAGLAVTVCNIFYVTAVLFAVYSLAAIGLLTIVDTLARVTGKLAVTIAIATLALVAWQAHHNYREFFGQRIFNELKQPYVPPGTFFVFSDTIRESIGRRAVFLIRDEPGRDFDAPLMSFAQELSSLAFMLETQPFQVDMVLFPPALIGSAEGVDVWVPNVPFTREILIPTLQRFYRGLSVTPIVPPQPYAARDDNPVAYRLAIERQEIATYHGLRDGEGLFYAATDAAYSFRQHNGTGTITIHGHDLTLGNGGILLERGLHPLHLNQGASLADIEVRGSEGEWTALADFVVHADGHAARELTPYLGRPGKRADFFYQLRLMLPHPGDTHAVEINPDGSFVSAARDATRWRAADGAVIQQIPNSGATPLLLARTSAGLVRIDEEQQWGTLTKDGFAPRGHVGCEPVEVLVSDTLTVVCKDGAIRTLPPQDPPRHLSSERGTPLQIVDATRAGNDFITADERSGRLERYAEDGRRLESRALPGLYYESDVETDPSGNLHIKQWMRGIRTYAADGRLLFNPMTNRSSLFMRSPALDANSHPLHRLRFNGDKAIAIGARDFVYTFERVNVE